MRQLPTINKTQGDLTTIQALRWRTEGKSYETIAELLGVSVASARKAVERGYNDLALAIRETTEELRALELRRLDAIQESLWEKRSDPFTAKILLQISHQRCKITGIYAPVKQQVVDKNGHPIPFDANSIAAEITSIGSALVASDRSASTYAGFDGASETGVDRGPAKN